MGNAGVGSRYGHAFRPGPFRRERAYWLDGGILHWRIGQDKGHVALADIVALRLYAPAEGEAGAACCRIVERSGRRHALGDRHWFGWTPRERHRWGRHQRNAATFTALTSALAQRLRRANPQARLLAGPGWAEWIASCLLAALLTVAVVAGVASMIMQQRLSWPALALMVLALSSVPLLWPVIRSGGPRPFDPDTAPPG